MGKMTRSVSPKKPKINGAEYSRNVAALHGLTDLFESFAAKPDIIIDNMPPTCVAPVVYSVLADRSWPTVANAIIEKHID